jgi:hypothetical protein
MNNLNFKDTILVFIYTCGTTFFVYLFIALINVNFQLRDWGFKYKFFLSFAFLISLVLSFLFTDTYEEDLNEDI